MTTEAADQPVRDRALDPGQSFIVQAPAGSGKTELLTRRVLTLLTIVDEPEEILAITFTRKAAAEMRQRVVQALQGAADDTAVANPYEQEGRLLATGVLQRDQERDWQLLENPSRLGMQTIDSLCSELTRQLPVTSKFGAELGVLEDASRLWTAAAERTIEENLQPSGIGHDALEKLLGYLDNNVPRLLRLLADMLANRDQWLRHYGQASSREQLETDLHELVDERFEALGRVVPDGLLEVLSTPLHRAAECAAALGTGPTVQELAKLLPVGKPIPAPAYATANIWQLLGDVLLTQNGSVRKSATRKDGFPINAADAAEVGRELEDLRSQKNEFMQLLDIARDADAFAGLLNETRVLPVAGYTDQQWEVMDCLLVLLRLSVAELHFVFAESGYVDFSEIALCASRALGEEDAPTDLALSLDYRLRHILVDEFQDTSISQFNLFSKLVAGWEPGDGRTFFAVGDPMQSIYRFRDAEVSLFIQAGKSGIGGIQLEELKLEVNFRSDPAIVDWCNDTFSRIFPSYTDVSTGAITYSTSTASRVFSPGAGQTLHAFVGDNRESQGRWVADLVEEALDNTCGDKAGEVAILVRSKSSLTEIFTALQEKKIQYQALDIETLGDRLVVRDICSLCRALQHPSDRLHWLALLRAPFCGLTLADLAVICGTERHHSIWSRMNDTQVVSALPDDARQRVARVISLLRPALERALRDSLVPWVEACWLALGGPAGFSSDVDSLAADACISELMRIEEEGLLWESSYVERRMNQLFAPALSGQQIRVQIMTIHKSKGLEFDTVILPALGRTPRRDQSQLLNWFEYYDDESVQPRLLLAPITETNLEGRSEPILNMVASLQRKKSDNELLRLLYVAATRAKRHLHLVGHVKLKANDELAEPPKSTLLNPLWSLVKESFDRRREPASTAEEVESSEPPAPQLKRIALAWSAPDFRDLWLSETSTGQGTGREPSVDAESPEYAWASTAARHVGSVVHRQLQRIAEEGVEHWPAERVDNLDSFYQSRLKASGVASGELDRSSASVRRALSNVLNDGQARWILDSKHAEAASELRVTGCLDGELVNAVIDRTFVDENNVRWIIDFKTGRHSGSGIEEFIDREQERYKPQLQRYAAIMRVNPDTEIRLGLYFPLHAEWREWSAAL